MLLAFTPFSALLTLCIPLPILCTSGSIPMDKCRDLTLYACVMSSLMCSESPTFIVEMLSNCFGSSTRWPRRWALEDTDQNELRDRNTPWKARSDFLISECNVKSSLFWPVNVSAISQYLIDGVNILNVHPSQLNMRFETKYLSMKYATKENAVSAL